MSPTPVTGSITEILDRRADWNGDIICRAAGFTLAKSRKASACCWTNEFICTRSAGFLSARQADRNAFIESFNGKFRAECLNTHRFMDIDDAQSKMEEGRKNYNEVRAHSAIGNNPPISLMNGSEIQQAH